MCTVQGGGAHSGLGLILHSNAISFSFWIATKILWWNFRVKKCSKSVWPYWWISKNLLCWQDIETTDLAKIWNTQVGKASGWVPNSGVEWSEQGRGCSRNRSVPFCFLIFAIICPHAQSHHHRGANLSATCCSTLYRYFPDQRRLHGSEERSMAFPQLLIPLPQLPGQQQVGNFFLGEIPKISF